MIEVKPDLEGKRSPRC